MFADYAARTPVGRIGRPEDVADAVAFLIGNGFVNGETIVCDSESAGPHDKMRLRP